MAGHDNIPTLAEQVSRVPTQPGCYLWKDAKGDVIYVGKAKNLRNRLTNYFHPLYQLQPRTQTMVLTARNLEWTVVGARAQFDWSVPSVR